MNDGFDDVAGNIRRRSTWLRILFMIGFCIALYVVGVVVLFVTVVQALFSLATGDDNRNLRLLGANLTEYVSQILRFLTYNSEARPFPFSPFPDAEDAEEEQSESGTPPAGSAETEIKGEPTPTATPASGEEDAGHNNHSLKEAGSTSPGHLSGGDFKASRSQTEEDGMSKDAERSELDKANHKEGGSEKGQPNPGGLAGIEVKKNPTRKDLSGLFANLEAGKGNKGGSGKARGDAE